jgi:hypothetical protein
MIEFVSVAHEIAWGLAVQQHRVQGCAFDKRSANGSGHRLQCNVETSGFSRRDRHIVARGAITVIGQYDLVLAGD